MLRFVLAIILPLIPLIAFTQPGPSVAKSKVLVLFDAFGKDAKLVKGWGYSALIEYNGKKILFDGGSNADVFKQNLIEKKVDPKSIDFVVISHAHYDHINGIDYLLNVNPKVKIYFPFDPFWGATNMFDARGQDTLVKDSLPPELRYFDGRGDVFAVPQAGGRFWHANVEHIRQSKEIMPGIRLVASSSHYMGYFSRYPSANAGQQSDANTRFTGLAELSLSLHTENGQALFVGCSHSGVDSIAKQAIAETNNKIAFLMGGFHLIPFNRAQTQKIVNYLKNELQIQTVAPGHCTGHLAFKLLKDAYGKQFIYAGLGEELSF